MHRLHLLLSLSISLVLVQSTAAQDVDGGRSRLYRSGTVAQPTQTETPVRTDSRTSQPDAARRIARERAVDNGQSSENQAASRSSQPKNIEAMLPSLHATAPYDVSSSGRFLVATQGSRGLMLFDTTTGRMLRQLQQQGRRGYKLVKISDDARWIAGVRSDDPDQIDLWRADNGRLVRTIEATGGTKASLAFSENGDELWVKTTSGNGVIYSIQTGLATGGFGSGSGRAAMAVPKVKAGPLTIRPPSSDQASAGQAKAYEQQTPPRQETTSIPYKSFDAPKLAAPATAAPRTAVPYRVQVPQAATPPVAEPMMAAPPVAEPMAASPPVAEPQAAYPFESAAPSAEPMAAMPAPIAEPQAAMPTDIPSAPSTAFAEESAIPESTPNTATEGSAPGADEVAPSAAQVAPPVPEDLSKVTVHYATNRNRLGVADRTWTAYFKGFFFSLPAVIVYVTTVLLVMVLPWFGKRSWAAVALVAGIVVLCSMGALEAYVRSQLRDELSGELYGSIPGNLNYGSCEISVPKPENRTAGEVNRPLSVWVFEAPENEDKHFVLKKVNEHADKDAFFESLSAQLARSEDGASLLFIHGYNVSFEDAIFRTAQLAVDLKYRGAPIAFSWPSYADPVKYTFDEQNAEVSIPAFREFLEDLATRSGAKRIHIIAHSMGNRVLAGALRAMSPEARLKNKAMFREIVMAAPDIDSRVFESQVLPHIEDNTQHCTLYASSHDRALMMSRYFHNYQRLGETEPQLIVASGMDTIDASLVDTSLLGHSYIGDVQSIVSDLHDLVVAGKRPVERGGLEEELLGELIYWAIKPSLQTAAEAATRR